MNWITEILTGNSPVHTIIALSLICALGLALGKVLLMGVSLGVAFVFFIGILAGHIGGEEQLGAMIEQNQIDLMIFFRDPLNPRHNEPDINKAIRLCDIHNVPLATNIASAEMLLKSLERGDLEWREMYR